MISIVRGEGRGGGRRRRRRRRKEKWRVECKNQTHTERCGEKRSEKIFFFLRALHLHLMLCDVIFICIFTYEDGGRVGMWIGLGGIKPKLSLATVHDFHLHLMLRCVMFSCACDATLYDCYLHSHI